MSSICIGREDELDEALEIIKGFSGNEIRMFGVIGEPFVGKGAFCEMLVCRLLADGLFSECLIFNPSGGSDEETSEEFAELLKSDSPLIYIDGLEFLDEGQLKELKGLSQRSTVVYSSLNVAYTTHDRRRSKYGKWIYLYEFDESHTLQFINDTCGLAQDWKLTRDDLWSDTKDLQSLSVDEVVRNPGLLSMITKKIMLSADGSDKKAVIRMLKGWRSFLTMDDLESNGFFKRMEEVDSRVIVNESAIKLCNILAMNGTYKPLVKTILDYYNGEEDCTASMDILLDSSLAKYEDRSDNKYIMVSYIMPSTWRYLRLNYLVKKGLWVEALGDVYRTLTSIKAMCGDDERKKDALYRSNNRLIIGFCEYLMDLKDGTRCNNTGNRPHPGSETDQLWGELCGRVGDDDPLTHYVEYIYNEDIIDGALNYACGTVESVAGSLDDSDETTLLRMKLYAQSMMLKYRSNDSSMIDTFHLLDRASRDLGIADIREKKLADGRRSEEIKESVEYKKLVTLKTICRSYAVFFDNNPDLDCTRCAISPTDEGPNPGPFGGKNRAGRNEPFLYFTKVLLYYANLEKYGVRAPSGDNGERDICKYAECETIDDCRLYFKGYDDDAIPESAVCRDFLRGIIKDYVGRSLRDGNRLLEDPAEWYKRSIRNARSDNDPAGDQDSARMGLSNLYLVWARATLFDMSWNENKDYVDRYADIEEKLTEAWKLADEMGLERVKIGVELARAHASVYSNRTLSEVMHHIDICEEFIREAHVPYMLECGQLHEIRGDVRRKYESDLRGASDEYVEAMAHYAAVGDLVKEMVVKSKLYRVCLSLDDAKGATELVSELIIYCNSTTDEKRQSVCRYIIENLSKGVYT